jgi:hypothetical protein
MRHNEMKENTYWPTDRDLVYDWAEKWLALIKFIDDVNRGDEPEKLPPSPAQPEEIERQRLGHCFTGYQAQSIP